MHAAQTTAKPTNLFQTIWQTLNCLAGHTSSQTLRSVFIDQTVVSKQLLGRGSFEFAAILPRMEQMCPVTKSFLRWVFNFRPSPPMHCVFNLQSTSFSSSSLFVFVRKRPPLWDGNGPISSTYLKLSFGTDGLPSNFLRLMFGFEFLIRFFLRESDELNCKCLRCLDKKCFSICNSIWVRKKLGQMLLLIIIISRK